MSPRVSSRKAVPQKDLAALLLRRARARLAKETLDLPSPLDALWSRFHESWLQSLSSDGPEALFLGTAGTPAFEVLAWLGEALALPADHPALNDAALAMLLVYFEVRCQDDLVDEGLPAETVYLELALESRASALLGRVSGDAAEFAPRMVALQQRFCATALWDARKRAEYVTVWEPQDIERLGEKYLPMALPLVALLQGQGRRSDIESMVQAVAALGTALQLTNDLLGVGKDLTLGLGSPFISLLGLVPSRHAERDIGPAIRALLGSGALDAHFDLIESLLGNALSSSSFLPGGRLASHIEARLDHLRGERLRHSLMALMSAAPAFRRDGRPVLTLDLEITRRCSLSCDACFVGAGPEAAEMALETVDAILQETHAHSTILHLTGGEPFSHPALRDILVLARRHGVRELLINTSGVLVTTEILSFIQRTGLETTLIVSVEGPSGANDRLRGPGAEARALHLLRNAARWHCRAQPASILSEALIRYGIRAWIRDLELHLQTEPVLTLWPLFLPPGASSQALGSPPGPELRQQAAREIAALFLEGRRVTIADGPTWNPILASFGIPKERLWQCEAGSGRLCVQADGMVSPCHPLRLSLTPLEPIHGFIERARASGIARQIASRQAQGCPGCAHQPICGGCRALVVGTGGELFSRDPTCPLLTGHTCSSQAPGSVSED